MQRATTALEDVTKAILPQLKNNLEELRLLRSGMKEENQRLKDNNMLITTAETQLQEMLKEIIEGRLEEVKPQLELRVKHCITEVETEHKE